MDIFLDWLVRFYLNNVANLRRKAPQIMPTYTHNMANVSRANIDSVTSFHLCIRFLLTCDARHISSRGRARILLCDIGLRRHRFIESSLCVTDTSTSSFICHAIFISVRVSRLSMLQSSATQWCPGRQSKRDCLKSSTKTRIA